MHNWLIFQYRRVHVKPNVDQEGAAFGRTLVVGGGRSEEHTPIPHCREKPSSELARRPYPKPTQVGA